MRKRNGQHSAKTCEHGTEARIVELGRAVVGAFDMDPASSAKWNQVVGAKRFLTKRDDCRTTPWVPGAPAPHLLVAPRGRARSAKRFVFFVNPPGDPKGELVAACWRATAGYFALGYASSAIWVGFSLEQLSRLQRIGAASHPLEHPHLIPCRRLDYYTKPGVSGEQPTHASYITLLTRSREEVARFAALGAELGHVGGLR